MKKTYKGLVEIGEPAHFANPKSILDEYYYSAFDCSGGMSEVADPTKGWENYKVYFDRVKLSEIDSRNFTITTTEVDEDGVPFEATMHGFNKFDIDYPEADPTEVYAIGVVACFSGEMELYPIKITADAGTRLWKVVYEGEDGMQYKITDTLYISRGGRAGDNKLIFVTDNVDEIYYDTYIEWGYAEVLPWYPDWIALDCSGDEEMFSAVALMLISKPSTRSKIWPRPR